MIGTIAWFDAAKGYGFIVPEDGGPDVFLHWRGFDASIPRDAAGHRFLEADVRVEYEVVDGPKGPQADKVRTTTTDSEAP